MRRTLTTPGGITIITDLAFPFPFPFPFAFAFAFLAAKLVSLRISTSSLVNREVDGPASLDGPVEGGLFLLAISA